MKKVIYIILWAVLGFILSFIAHAVIEIIYLKYTDNVTWVLGGACALPLWLIILLPVLGLIFGIFTGLFFWQKIYVEKKFRK